MLTGKRAFTLIEMIFTIIILAFVLIGGFQIVGKLYKRNYIAKETSKMEFVSQSVLDELALRLYYRIPLSVIGYDGVSDFKYIGDIQNSDQYKILEWIGYENDAMVDRNLSGFVDLYASKKPVLKALDFNSNFINQIIQNKFGGSLTSLAAIIFAGSFDVGENIALVDYKNAFGWHGNGANLVHTISKITQNGNDCDIAINNNDNIKIYEKFYLADSAYAIAKGSDIDQNAQCIKNLNISGNLDNVLFLFFNYRPWKGETFCADKGSGGTKDGNVTVLAFNVNSFRVKKVNSHLELKLQLLKSRGDINISVSKQKVTF